MNAAARRVLWLAVALVAAACGLNPQPGLPSRNDDDGEAAGGTKSSGGTANPPGTVGGSGVVAEPGDDGGDQGGESAGGQGGESVGGQGGESDGGEATAGGGP